MQTPPSVHQESSSKDTAKSTVFVTTFWETDKIPAVNPRPAIHSKCVGTKDRMIGFMISNMGPIYYKISKVIY